MTRTVLDDAPRAAGDAKQLLEQIHQLELIALVTDHVDFEVRMGIAFDLLELTDRLRTYAMRVRG